MKYLKYISFLTGGLFLVSFFIFFLDNTFPMISAGFIIGGFTFYFFWNWILKKIKSFRDFPENPVINNKVTIYHYITLIPLIILSIYYLIKIKNLQEGQIITSFLAALFTSFLSYSGLIVLTPGVKDTLKFKLILFLFLFVLFIFCSPVLLYIGMWAVVGFH